MPHWLVSYVEITYRRDGSEGWLPCNLVLEADNPAIAFLREVRTWDDSQVGPTPNKRVHLVNIFRLPDDWPGCLTERERVGDDNWLFEDFLDTELRRDRYEE